MLTPTQLAPPVMMTGIPGGALLILWTLSFCSSLSCRKYSLSTNGMDGGMFVGKKVSGCFVARDRALTATLRL